MSLPSTETAGQPAHRPRLHQLSSDHLPKSGALGGRSDLLREAGPTWKGAHTYTHIHTHITPTERCTVPATYIICQI